MCHMGDGGEVLSPETVGQAILDEVRDVEVIDVHTHLLHLGAMSQCFSVSFGGLFHWQSRVRPPTHGKLMLWGIDELLTYHYLVLLGRPLIHTWPLRSEYFMVAPAKLTHELFFSKPKTEQAELVWQGLFVERTPISEACQGVITTLQRQGINSLVSSQLVTSTAIIACYDMVA